MASGEGQRFFPNLRTERCWAKNSGGLMLQKKVTDGARLLPGPLLPEYPQFQSVGELGFARSRQHKMDFTRAVAAAEWSSWP